MKLKLLKIVTTYQSVVTILNSKLKILAKHNNIDLFIASSFEDPVETRKAAGHHFIVPISRNINLIKDFISFIRIYKFLKKEKINIVHTHTAKAGIIGTLATFVAGVPTVHTYHGLPFFEGQNIFKHNIYKFIELFFSRLRNLILSQNRSDYERLKRIKGIKCPVIFEANGINAEDIIQNADKYLDNVKNIFDDDKIHLLCIARLEPVKRIEKVFEAVEFLLSNNIRINCVIAGKGRLENRLKNQIRRKKLESCISIVYSPYIHSIIKKADIVVLTSEKEGIPRSLMEAMALKKPVVATDVLGTNELVLHNDTGYLVSIDDQEDFNRLLLKLIDDPGLRVRFGEAGYKRVVEEFSDEKIVDLWVEWYLRLMGSMT